MNEIFVTINIAFSISKCYNVHSKFRKCPVA